MKTKSLALIGIIVAGAVFAAAPSNAQSTAIGIIQSYNPTTGLPSSPFANQEVTVKGAVYALKGTLSEGGFYLQDATGGINYFAPFAEGIAVGDSIRVTAPVYEYEGEIYLHDSDAAPDFEIIGTGRAPEVSDFSVVDLVASYENVGWLVGVVGTLGDITVDGFTVNAGGAAVPVHVSALTGIDLTHLQDSREIVVHGACIIRNGEIQVWPRSPLDVNGGHDPMTLHVSLAGSDLSGDGSEGNPYATIQKAIDVAADEDEVWVLPGTYTGDGNRDIDFKGRAIAVKSRDEDPATCIVDCQGSESEPHRGFIFQNREGPDSILIGFTVTNGYADARGGGGVLVQQTGYLIYDFAGSPDKATVVRGAASPTLDRLHIVGNTGGGLYRTGSSYEGVSMLITGCVVSGNVGMGFCYLEWYGVIEIVDSVFSNNTGLGAQLGVVTTTVKRCEFRGNGGGGVAKGEDGSSAYFESCVIADNQGHGIFSVGFTSSIKALDCSIENNTGYGVWLKGDHGTWCQIKSSSLTGNGLGGLNSGRGSPNRVEVDSCSVGYNNGSGVIVAGIGSYVTARISNSEIYNNQRSGIDFTGRMLALDSVTFAGNDSLGIAADADSLFCHRVISAYNGEGAIGPIDFTYLEFSCNDFFGNTGGDWSGPIAGQLGVNGNISADPRFCDLAATELTLRSDSPCLEGNHPDGDGCGQIGALGIGCYLSEPAILAIADVANDQGRQVRVEWARSALDEADSPTSILEYALFRQRNPEDEITAAAYPPGAWDFLMTVPADGEDYYSVIGPTIGDSTITNGPFVSTFFVRARTGVPTVYFDSAPDSGYSVDNLVPNAPENFLVAYGSVNLLTWEGGDDPDFRYFRIYDAEPDTVLKTTIALEWTDTVGSHQRSYRITAVDFAGNESAGLLSVSVVSGVEDIHPRQFSLMQNHPNPFNPATTISYDVPRLTTVTIHIYDVSGRLVRRLRDGEFTPAGRHRATWRGRDDQGQPVAAGVYFYSLQAGDFSETKRMILVK